MPDTPCRIVVGLSGGVDSAVSAYLLKQAGFRVEALFMKNWEEDDTESYCSATVDRQDAEAVCELLKIPFHTANFSAEYWDRVFEHFLETYKKGWTPNPDILCNQEIKFKAFFEHALAMGFEKIATGHYAGKIWHGDQAQLRCAADSLKDQTYFLYRISQEALQKTLFPLAALTKKEVRNIAESLGLPNSQKKDSTGICFIGERRFKTFLKTYLEGRQGDICTLEGKTLGVHEGLMFYTLGQRHGLGIGGQKGALEMPWYVVAKDILNNRLIVVQGADHPWHYATELEIIDTHWIGSVPAASFEAMARIRHRQPLVPCQVTQLETNRYKVIFKTPQFAATPGQACVLYQESLCLGGGTIAQTNSLGGIWA